MFTVRNRNDRGSTETGWLKSHHSFSFSEYYDPAHMGFGPLRVINEDWINPSSGFGMHAHKNMEIITYILSGALAHKDSISTGSTITPGEIQLMSAGKGILHSEVNSSETDAVHLLQIWIMPNENGTKPGYQQKTVAPETMQNRFQLVVSPDGADGSLTMRQDAKLLAAKLTAGHDIRFDTDSRRKYWLQVARGALDFRDQRLFAGDGLAIDREQSTITLAAQEDAEVLLFDLPL